jgi:hypothetical protein
VRDEHGRDARPANLLDHRQREAAHRPPGDDVGAKLAQVALKLDRVVAGEAEALQPALVGEAVALQVPVPAQRPVHVRILLWAFGDAIVAREDADSMPLVPGTAHGGLPAELVASGVLGRIHVAHCEDPQRLRRARLGLARASLRDRAHGRSL